MVAGPISKLLAAFILITPARCFLATTERPRLQPSLILSSSLGNPDELKEAAARLRVEISSFEERKRQAELDEQRRAEELLERQQKERDVYAAVVPILKPNGTVQDEIVSFPPFHSRGSRITVCEASLPLGLILGEGEQFPGAVTVDEVADDGNGAAAGVKVGDIVRAFTACKMQMEQPTWQLIVGGVGRPRMFRYMYSADNKAFEEVMGAMASNRFDPETRAVLLVIERKEGHDGFLPNDVLD